MISAQCVACDLHMTVPWPFKHMLEAVQYTVQTARNLNLHLSVPSSSLLFQSEMVVGPECQENLTWVEGRSVSQLLVSNTPVVPYSEGEGKQDRARIEMR